MSVHLRGTPVLYIWHQKQEWSLQIFPGPVTPAIINFVLHGANQNCKNIMSPTVQVSAVCFYWVGILNHLSYLHTFPQSHREYYKTIVLLLLCLNIHI